MYLIRDQEIEPEYGEENNENFNYHA